MLAHNFRRDFRREVCGIHNAVPEQEAGEEASGKAVTRSRGIGDSAGTRGRHAGVCTSGKHVRATWAVLHNNSCCAAGKITCGRGGSRIFTENCYLVVVPWQDDTCHFPCSKKQLSAIRATLP